MLAHTFRIECSTVLVEVGDDHEWREEAVSFLALQSIRGVGYKTLYNLASRGVRFKQLLGSETADEFEYLLQARPFQTRSDQTQDWFSYVSSLCGSGERLMGELERKNIKLLFNAQSSFPEKLRQIPDPPFWLFVEGNPDLLRQPSIAVVGTRNATGDGISLTQMLIAALADQEVVIVSGLAEGIDQKAHNEALRFHLPTIAVLGTGIDQEFPKHSNALRSRIVASGGAIITEYLPNQSYSGENFVRRNRLQVGLSEVVIPVEWKLKSGTAHTVSFAKAYGRALAMPYMPFPNLDSIELDTISKYLGGEKFKFPQQSVDFLMYIRSRLRVKEAVTSPGSTQNKNDGAKLDSSDQLSLIPEPSPEEQSQKS